MSRGSLTQAARLRGVAAGALTAALSAAAHSTAGGGLPSGAASAFLLLVAVTIGALAAATRRAAHFPALVALLALGQLLGHAVLAAIGHSHAAAPGSPWGVMVAAHVTAVAVGAALIVVGGQLCGALSRVLLVRAQPRHQPVAAAVPRIVRGADQPLHSARQLAASVSHRGPPVSLAR